MSLSSTSTLKSQLTVALAPNAASYFGALNAFVIGQSSRTEFEELAKALLNTASLVLLHNALIISLFDATAILKRPLSPPPPTLLKQPPRKRRRTLLPYQGPHMSEDARTLRSHRLKRWALGVGKRERERFASLHDVPPTYIPGQGRRERDEIVCERGVVLLPERGESAGSRMPLHLHSTTRAPTLQHIVDRVNLICAQHNLGMPSRTLAHLLNLACEAKLKQLITHALTLTSTSLAISSVTTSASHPSASHSHHHHPGKPPVLTPASFQTLFTLSPADLPTKSAAAMRLAMTLNSAEDDSRDLVVLKDREVRDQRWQIMALLGERSTVRAGLRGVK